MLKPKTACSLDRSTDIEDKILIEKWKRRNSSKNMTINKEAVKVASTNVNLTKVTNVNKNTKSQDNAPKAKIINIQKDITFDVSQGKVDKRKIIKHPSDIEISFSSKKQKFSRTSLPASIKQSSVVEDTKVFPRKSDSHLQAKKLITKTPNIICGIEITKGLASNNTTLLNKKNNSGQSPKSIFKNKPNITCNIESVKKLDSNTKVSAKKQIGFPLNLEKMFKKKSNAAFTMENVKNPDKNSNKTNNFDKKSSPNLKSKKIDKRKSTMITYGIISTASSSNDTTKISNKTKTPDLNTKVISIERPKSSKSSDVKPIRPIKNEEQFELDPKTGEFVRIISIPSFSTDSFKNHSVQNSFTQADNQDKKLPIITSVDSLSSIFGNENQNTTKQVKNVYVDLLDTYRYLVTPKTWSVMEMISNTNEQCIVFFNTNVIKEKNVFISVMKKSLIIDKESKMHYSVHGLPVDLKSTILPKVLDSTKKLLSILHIFDKMQICEGVGDDLDIIQDEAIFKDTCRMWRHIDCKIILMKSTRCPICTETRDILS